MLDTLTNSLARVSTPAFMLSLFHEDGSFMAEITDNVYPRLISLNVIDNRGFEADQFTLILDDSDGEIQLPERHKRLRVALGYKEGPLIGVGDFIIDQVVHEGAPDRVTVTGRSADFSGTFNTERDESWHDTTLGAVVEAIAARNKMESAVAETLAPIKIAHLDQSQESDASFLRRLAIRNGAEIAVKWNTLMLIQPGRNRNARGTLFEPVTLYRSDGDMHKFSTADRMNYSGVTARWLDTRTPKKQTPKVGLTAATKEKPAYTAGSKGNTYAMATIFATQTEAKTAADALWSAIQRNTASFSFTLAKGRADLTPETPVQVVGFKTVIDNIPWVINKVTHVMSRDGYITKLELEVKIDEGQYELHDS